VLRRKRNVLRSKIRAEELPSVMAQMITDSGSACGDEIRCWRWRAQLPYVVRLTGRLGGLRAGAASTCSRRGHPGGGPGRGRRGPGRRRRSHDDTASGGGTVDRQGSSLASWATRPWRRLRNT